LTSSETLRRVAEILQRLAGGGKPDPGALAAGPPAEAWSAIPDEDVYRIGSVAPPAARPLLVPLLAIDPQDKWALVLIDDRIEWWRLGDPLPETAAPEPAEVMRRAADWTRRRLR
jgi:hypothetical protein